MKLTDLEMFRRVISSIPSKERSTADMTVVSYELYNDEDSCRIISTTFNTSGFMVFQKWEYLDEN